MSITATAVPAVVAAVEVGFFAGALAFVAAWAVVIIAAAAMFGILAVHNDSPGWAVFWMILLGAVFAYTFQASLTSMATAAAAYVVVGLLWSFWRYKRFVTKKVAEYKDRTVTEREFIIRKMHPGNMLGTIVSWIIVWPFSVIENLTGDVIEALSTLVTKVFRGIYHRIYESAVSSLTKL